MAVGRRLLLMFVMEEKENKGKRLARKEKRQPVCTHVCVHAHVYLSGGIQGGQNKQNKIVVLR